MCDQCDVVKKPLYPGLCPGDHILCEKCWVDFKDDGNVSILCPLCPDRKNEAIVMWREDYDRMPKTKIPLAMVAYRRPGKVAMPTKCETHDVEKDRFCMKCEMLICHHCECHFKHRRHLKKPEDVTQKEFDNLMAKQKLVWEKEREEVKEAQRRLDRAWEKKKKEIAAPYEEKIEQVMRMKAKVDALLAVVNKHKAEMQAEMERDLQDAMDRENTQNNNKEKN